MNDKRTKALLGAVFLFLTLFFVSHLDALLGVWSVIVKGCSPILWGLALAFLLNLPLRLLERGWKRIPWQGWQRARRPVCLLLTVLLSLGILTLLCFALLPRLIDTLLDFLRGLPERLASLEAIWEKVRHAAESVSLHLPPLDLDGEAMTEFLGGLWDRYGHVLVEISWDLLIGSVGTVWNAVLAFALSLYVLARKERVGAQVKKLLRAVFPDGVSAGILRVASLSSRTFGKFLGGQLVEAVILGGLCFLGMVVLRIPFALLISVLVGVTALIPVFGAFIGMGVGALLILSAEPIKALWFLIFLLILQQVEGNLIYPRVVGKSVGLDGVWVLMAVTLGSSFGVVGMLLAVPLASVLYTLAKEFAEKRLKQYSIQSNEGGKN